MEKKWVNRSGMWVESTDIPIKCPKECGGTPEMTKEGHYKCNSCYLEIIVRNYGEGKSILKDKEGIKRLTELIWTLTGRDRISKKAKTIFSELMDLYPDFKRLIHSIHFQTWDAKGNWSSHDRSNVETGYILQNLYTFADADQYAKLIAEFLVKNNVKFDVPLDVTLITYKGSIKSVSVTPLIESDECNIYKYSSTEYYEKEGQLYSKRDKKEKILEYFKNLPFKYVKVSIIEDDSSKLIGEQRTVSYVIKYLENFR